ncbi:MAG TPA: ABC transporter substrate-binding protein [Methanospirillum sp.]|uniref:ABC transporter substrate-binding protein n=1 Tax=Methanospirillum sp. TaxID=45200 RepID=UPI002CEC1F3B|nr:ABC transporter substrate-binding protein [Methanospirillum sp.]HOJ96914.1 ABC transporter substrate-binding protein [Methanospirillum sp.]HPP77667.1 ABC transporter substrate-binding protein [Methanospirillum sp.]
MKHVWLIVSLFLMTGLVLLCGCTGTQKNPAAPVQGAAGEKSVLNIGYQPSTHQMAFMTAYSKGMYNETLAPLGIKEVKAYSFPTGAPEMQAMLAGDLDFAYVGAAPFVTAVATGLDGKIIAAAQTQGSSVVLKSGLNYTSPADLKGLTIATFPAGTIQDTILRTWLKKQGLDPEKDVKIVAMGPGDATTAIMAGKVDAVFLPAPSPTTIEEAGAGKIIVQSGEMEPNHVCCVLVASGKMIREHPDIVTEVLKIHEKATKYNQENWEEAAQYMEQMTAMNTSVIMKSLHEWDGAWVSDPNIIADSVTSYAQDQAALGYIKTPLSGDDLIDTSFWAKL